MATLIFTPWYDIHVPATVGRYQLIPFDTTIANPSLGTLDLEAKAILKSYLKQPFTAAQPRENIVKNATLIRMSSGTFDSDEIEVLQYVVAFAGIADRQFTDSTRYLCSDNFKFVVQSYPTPIPNPFDPSITTFKKDGTIKNGFGTNVFREVKPWHIANQSIFGNTQFRLIFNEPVGQCLWEFFQSAGAKQDVWTENIFPALFSFYQANTDGHSQQMDCIYSEAAFEKLFLGSGHGEQNLVNRIQNFIQTKNVIFETVAATNRNWQSITYHPRRGQPLMASSTIFEAWIRELVRLRNRYAHGGHGASGTWVWSLWEHLFLSSFIFPLLLKLYISQFDPTTAFAISADDFKKIRMFERMLAEDNYFKETYQHSGITRWGQLISDARGLI